MAGKHDPDLDRVLGKRATILAEGFGPDGPVLIGTKDRVAVKRDDGWVAMGWDEVERGSWRGQTGIFRWSDMHGDEFEAKLEEPGRIPELFQERVQASTLMTFHYELDPGELRLVIRRGLDAKGELRFFAVPSGGANLDNPATRAFIVEETDRIKAEYGLDWH